MLTVLRSHCIKTHYRMDFETPIQRKRRKARERQQRWRERNGDKKRELVALARKNESEEARNRRRQYDAINRAISRAEARAEVLARQRAELYDVNDQIERRDFCDCLNPACTGCHFPCPKCLSLKCSTDCREDREWAYPICNIEGTND